MGGWRLELANARGCQTSCLRLCDRCAPQVLRSVPRTASRRQFESVLVMKPAEDRPRQDPMADRQAMTISLLRNRRRYRLRNAWSEASVGPPAIVIRGPFVKHSTKMLFSDRNDPIE